LCLCVQVEVHLTDDLHVKINGCDDVRAAFTCRRLHVLDRIHLHILLLDATYLYMNDLEC
jgi:hypothetical protein